MRRAMARPQPKRWGPGHSGKGAMTRDSILLTGIVLEVHRGDVYTVELGSPERRTIKAVKAGRLHHRHIRITAGDKVTVEVSPYDPAQGRIVRRE